MPIYEYQCSVCHHRFSVLQRIGEDNEHLICEQCGTPKPTKQFSAFASIGNTGRSDRNTGGHPGSGSRFT